MHIEAFSTERFVVAPWRPLLRDAGARGALERALAAILTPPVLAHLPPSLQLDPAEGAVSAWIEARDAESEVLSVHTRADRRLIGLILLAADPEARDRPSIHVGYLFAESVWGQGVASEVVRGLVAALGGPARLVAGVDPDNPASARVLQKAGFRRDPVLSSPRSEVYTLDIA